MNQPSARAGDAEHLGDFFGVLAGFQAGGKDDHIHRDAALLADQCILDLNDQLAFFAFHARHVGYLSHLAADE